MRSMCRHWFYLLILVPAAVTSAAFGQTNVAWPSADEIVRHLVQHSQTNGAAEAQGYYLCKKQTVTEELDPAGHVTSRKVNVGESRSAPSGATEANRWGSQNGITLDGELLRRYQFTPAGIEDLNGRPAFVLTFVPKHAPLPVHHFQDRLLNLAMGTIWVDVQEYELVKASIFLREPVSFGILGAIDALNFAFERARADEGAWLTCWTETFFKGRKLLKPLQFRKLARWSDFKRLDGTAPDPGRSTPG